MNRFFILILFVFLGGYVSAQTTQEKLDLVESRYKELNSLRDSIKQVREELKLTRSIEKINKRGIPELQEGDELVCHSAMCLVFDDNFQLAKWVVHILSPAIIEGRVARSNDYRADPKISNTGIEADYFLRFEQDDGSYRFEGFGYDRGHLAPSADFRWSETALSESYYYSNITPQTPEFNREKWAEIEAFLRTYVYNNPENYLYVVTAPVLREGLPVIERGVNQLPIPELHYKIAVDYEREIGVAFLVPQRDLRYPIDTYVVTIDSIENLTGINFFEGIAENKQRNIKSSADLSKWRPEELKDQVRPMTRSELPANTYNTVEAREMIGYHRDVTVCGTVVRAHKSARGNVFLNLDQAFPNQIFTGTIWARDVLNFDYDPHIFYQNKKVCITGQVQEYRGTPFISIRSSRRISVIE